MKFVVRLFLKDELLGSFDGCGYLISDDEVEIFLFHELTNHGTDDLERLAAEVKRSSEDGANELMHHFQRCLENKLGIEADND